MKKTLLIVVAVLFVVTSAQAAIVTYSGVDAGVYSGPNSATARAAFDAAANPTDEITFEDLAVGTFVADPYTPVGVYPGVNVNYFGDVDPSASSYFGVTDSVSLALGFNTTLGGENYLGFVPDGSPSVTPGMTWTFADPINAWGAYVSGLEPDINGVLHVLFDDGSMHDLLIPDGSDGGGIQFFGFTTDGAITAIDFELQGVVIGTRDIFGIDDVVFARVPEPATLLLLGAGLVGVGVARRRMRD